ncbi:MAG: GNAT family N-acetyltransferase [Planctomycetia bacterium]|nr:GNAT family N-acetyltransferase [Planctomycetia bacterium]
MRIAITEETALTEMERSDAPAFLKYCNDRDIYRTTLRIPLPYTEKDAQSFLDFVAETTEKNGRPVNLAIRHAGGELIGCIGLGEHVVGTSHRAEMGYWIARPFWGRGIATAAVAAMCGYAFGELKLAKLTGHVFSFNPASSRVLEKNGFELEGRLRRHYLKDGEFIDALAYGRLNG